MSSDDDDDQDLVLPDDDKEAQFNANFNSFRSKDMVNPVFKVGMVFESMENLRAAITEYSLRNRVDIKLPRNEKVRLRAHCADGCP